VYFDKGIKVPVTPYISEDIADISDVVEFVDMLNEMRLGILHPATVEQFTKLSRPVSYSDGIEATELYHPLALSFIFVTHILFSFAMRWEVEKANHSRLEQLPPPAYEYTAVDTGGYNSRKISPDQIERLLKPLIVPKNVVLKVCGPCIPVNFNSQFSLVIWQRLTRK